MGRYIVKLQDYYLEWSTIVDAPTTLGMTLAEFNEYYKEMYGLEGMQDLPYRMARVENHGTSALEKEETPATLFICNRAGPNEDELTENEIYKAYCLQEPIRDGWLARNGR